MSTDNTKTKKNKAVVIFSVIAAALIAITITGYFLLPAVMIALIKRIDQLPESIKYETIYDHDIYAIKTDIDEEWVVGKTHAEIAEGYGNGDRIEILDLGEGYVVYLFFKYGDANYLDCEDTDICTGTYRMLVS